MLKKCLQLLNIKRKTKDGVQAHQDLVDIGISFELHQQLFEKRTYLLLN